MGHALKINPVFKEMIWGGSCKIVDVAHDIPSDNIARSVGHSQLTKWRFALLVMEEFAGKILSSLWDEHRELFKLVIEGDQFPLLQMVDARIDLSVQVHPMMNNSSFMKIL